MAIKLTEDQIETRINGERICRICKIPKTAKHFEKIKEITCNECKYSKAKIRKAQNPLKYHEMQRRAHLRHKYGIEPEDYDEILKRQEYRCAICRSKKPGGKYKRFQVDHCHKNQFVRGLLCWKFNTFIGAAKESRSILLSAIKYLAKGGA